MCGLLSVIWNSTGTNDIPPYFAVFIDPLFYMLTNIKLSNNCVFYNLDCNKSGFSYGRKNIKS